MKSYYKITAIVDGGAILFPESVVHIQVGHGFKELNQKKIYSAGFCVVEYLSPSSVKVFCHGDSESLKIKSQPLIDERIILQTMFSEINPYKYDIKTIKEQYE